jgi:glycosyltransferase involved in cell wall biosynthesis
VFCGLSLVAKESAVRPLNTERHVLFVHPFDALAGSQRVAVALIRAFYGLHCTVSVLLGFGSNGFVARVEGVRAFLSVNHVGWRKALYPLWLAMMWPRMLWAVWRREIVWANTIHAIPAVLVVLALAPSRVVVHVHEIEYPRLFGWLLDWAVSRGATVLCVSDFQRRQLELRADVLHNCVDKMGETPPTQPPVLLFVGAVSALKGFPLFVEVVSRLPAGMFSVVACVPSLPDSARGWIERAQQLGVIFRCGLSDPEEMFAGATLLIQCTDPLLATETFSLVMSEALAFGVPVATTGMGVASEVLADAWAFDEPSREPDLIASKILALCQDGPKLASLRAAALARRRHFSFPIFQQRVGDVLDGVTRKDIC